MGIHIRVAQPEDAHDYVLCNVECWRSAYQGILPDAYLEGMTSEVERRTSEYRRSFRNPGNLVYFCAESEGKIVGRLVVGQGRDWDKPDAGEVGAIYLLEAFWGKGYGKELMDHGVQTLKGMGYQDVFLWVLEKNSRARRFYERYGFVPDGQTGKVEYGAVLQVLRYVLSPI